MPIATPEIYSEMIDRAKTGGFAFPAVNVTSSQTLNAALRGFAEAESDGIVQVSTGGAAYWSGASTKDMVAGSLGFAAFAREVAKNYGVNIALHTDHCPKDKLDGFVLPLLAASEAEVKAGRNPLFNSHMWDGSAETLQENLRIARELLERTAAAKMILEVEIGTVGGEEDGVENAINDKLYTTVEDALATIDALGSGENGRYITALTFGNVHGVYKPGGVKLRPEILKDIQEQVGAKIGKANPFDLVFHGGSGSSDKEIADAVSYGVIKMNIDTDTQYAYTRPVVDHMFRNYDGVLKVDGEVGNKKLYDPRVWGASAEAGLAARVVEAAQQLGLHRQDLLAMSDEFRKNLMGPEPTLLPAESEIYQHLALGQEAVDLVAKHPTSSLLWAILAEEAWDEGRTIDSYAYSRVGYHRGLDSLRRNGWRGVGPIPWEHEPNRGFLRSLYSLGRASAAIGEAEEPERIEKFLKDSDPGAKAAIEAEG